MPSVGTHSPITKLTPGISHLIRQSILTPQSQTIHQSCLTHSFSSQSKLIHKPHPTATPLTPSVSIHNPITNLTPQLSHSLHQFVFITRSQTSPHSCLTHSIGLYSQLSHKTHPTTMIKGRTTKCIFQSKSYTSNINPLP
jgi:hypothetical protein